MANGNSKLPEEFQAIADALRPRGLELTLDQCQRISDFVDLLLRWNRKINLVGSSERRMVLRRHILDCLAIVALPWPKDALDVVDIGSGAGLPGLMIALLYPGRRIVSVDRAAKKIDFQLVARETLGLRNFTPEQADIDNLPGTSPASREAIPQKYDLAVARAFADLGKLMTISARRLKQ